MACLTCNVLTGFVAGCNRTPAGGFTELYFIQYCDVNIDAITRDGYNNDSGIVSNIPLNPGACWQKVVARRETVNYTDATVSLSGTFIPQLQFQIDPSAQGDTKAEARQAALDFVRNLVQAPTGLVIIFKEGNGVRRVIGLNGGANATDATAYDSGTARTDIATQTIQVNTSDTEQPPVLDDDYVIAECA